MLPRATVGTVLSIRVSGLGIDAVPEGVLSLAGCQIPLQNGEGGILFDLFLNGIRNAVVSLRRPDGTEGDGKLMFLWPCLTGPTDSPVRRARFLTR